MKVSAAHLHLYWVATPDHEEDWFIFAGNRRSAQRFHEDYEGYSPGHATAELAMRNIAIKPGKGEVPPFHAQAEHLMALGCTILQVFPGQRAVLCNGRLFVEGHPESLVVIGLANMSEAIRNGRPRGSSRPVALT